MRVSSAVAHALRVYGVDTVFGLMGTGTLKMVQCLVHEQAVRYLACAREDGAVTMADGYARARQSLGVAMVTYGPAFANIPHSLTEAARNRTPLVVIAGDTPSHRRLHFQHIDHAAYTQPTGAGFVAVRAPHTVVADVREAIRRAWVERRPVVLNIPIDYQDEQIGEVAPEPLRLERFAPAPDPDRLDLVAGMLATADRPLILAGYGAALAGARDELVALGELLGAPLATTVKAKGMFTGAPHDLGIFGGLASEVASQYIARADCVIAFGAALNDFTTLDGELTRGKRVIHVDVEPNHLGRYFPVDLELLADARLAARALVELLGTAELTSTGFASPALADELRSYDPASTFKDASGEQGLDIRTVTIALDSLLPADRGLVTDVGHFFPAPMRYLRVPGHRDYLNAATFGSVGLGLSIATGMAIARPERPTVLVAGDGGLMMGLAEFNTAVRFGADLIAVVLNNGGYAQEWHHLRNQGLDETLSLLDWPDLAAVGTALGGTGITVRTLEELRALPEAIAQRDRPLLLDIRIDPSIRMGVTD